MKNSVLTGCKTNNGLTLFYTVFGVVRISVTISLSRLSQLSKVVRDVKVRNLMTILTVCSTFHDSSRDNWIT